MFTSKQFLMGKTAWRVETDVSIASSCTPKYSRPVKECAFLSGGSFLPTSIYHIELIAITGSIRIVSECGAVFCHAEKLKRAKTLEFTTISTIILMTLGHWFLIPFSYDFLPNPLKPSHEYF